MPRYFDLLIALFLIVFLSPLLFLICVSIPLVTGDSPIFRQQRVGRFGANFTILKFRTMTVLEGDGKGMFGAGDTSRVTSIGRWLRRSKMDELPQLFNVIWGDMAIVGPRPEVRRWVDEYPDQWAAIHTILPGITDPASIVFRNEEVLLEGAQDPDSVYKTEILPVKLDLYQLYIRERSMLGDFQIIMKTIKAVFK